MHPKFGMQFRVTGPTGKWECLASDAHRIFSKDMIVTVSIRRDLDYANGGRVNPVWFVREKKDLAVAPHFLAFLEEIYDERSPLKLRRICSVKRRFKFSDLRCGNQQTSRQRAHWFSWPLQTFLDQVSLALQLYKFLVLNISNDRQRPRGKGPRSSLFSFTDDHAPSPIGWVQLCSLFKHQELYIFETATNSPLKWPKKSPRKSPVQTGLWRWIAMWCTGVQL